MINLLWCVENLMVNVMALESNIPGLNPSDGKFLIKK